MRFGMNLSIIYSFTQHNVDMQQNLSNDTLCEELKAWIYMKINQNGLSAYELHQFQPSTASAETLKIPASCVRNPDRCLRIANVRSDVGEALVDLCEAGAISFTIDTHPLVTAGTLSTHMKRYPFVTDSNKFSRQTKDAWMLLSPS
jgi:hypothetical protein